MERDGAATYADKMAIDYAQDVIGQRRHEPEYTTNGFGHTIHNPNYLKRHPAQPGLGAEWLWDAIWGWWRANEASPEQEQILKAAESLKGEGYKYGYDWQIRKGGGSEAGLVSYGGMYVLDPNGKCDWDGKGKRASLIEWEHFASLRKVKA